MSYIMFEYGSSGKRKSIILPVNPEELMIDRDDISETVNVINRGEIPIPSKTGLIRATIETFIPKSATSPFLSVKSKKTHAGDIPYWRKKFKAFHQKGTVITVSVVGVRTSKSIDTRFDATVTSFSYGWIGGTQDLQISVGLRQYRPIEVKIWTKKKKKKKSKKSSKKTSSSSKKGTIKVGSRVICTGYLYRQSDKTGRGGKESKAIRVVSVYKRGAKAPYHVKTTGGGSRGWMEAKDVRLA